LLYSYSVSRFVRHGIGPLYHVAGDLRRKVVEAERSVLVPRRTSRIITCRRVLRPVIDNTANVVRQRCKIRSLKTVARQKRFMNLGANTVLISSLLTRWLSQM
jgi:hypothetical protein